jgi:hypothetical protein
MAADPGFLLRLYAETARLLQQQDRQGRAIRLPPTAPPLQKALGMLLLPEDQLPACSKAIRAEAAGTGLAAEIDDVIAAILVSRFSGCTVPEPCARGCKAHKASCPPISPSPAPPVVLQRMSLPADRHSRRAHP